MTLPLLIDVDGVLANFLSHVDASIGPVDWSKGWELEACLLPARIAELHAIVEGTPGWCASLPELPGACDLVRSVIASGRETVFVTSPWRGCPTWVHERTQWLESRFPGATIIHTNAKCHVRGILFDDNERHVHAHPWDAYLIKAPYTGDRGMTLAWALRVAGALP